MVIGDGTTFEGWWIVVGDGDALLHQGGRLRTPLVHHHHHQVGGEGKGKGGCEETKKQNNNLGILDFRSWPIDLWQSI